MRYEVTNDEYLISDNSSRLDVPFIHNFLANESYWAKDIPFAIVEKSIANSLCFGLYHKQQQIGFARLVTDKATFAYLADVFIVPEYRGRGLSCKLIAAIHAHPELETLRRWMLATRDAHELYKKFGWTSLPEPDRFMQKHNPNVYQ
jgi:N-acetylglutamate synthase-like GNAT family acetyltransferase